MKLQSNTRARITADMRTVLIGMLQPSDYPCFRTLIDGPDSPARRRTMWNIWLRVIRDRRDDDTHPRFTTQTVNGDTFIGHKRYLPQATDGKYPGDFDSYPDDANDSHFDSFFRSLKSSDLLPAI